MLKYIVLPLFWSLWYLSFTIRTIIAPYLPIIEDELTINHAMAGGLYLFTSAGATVALALAGFLATHIGYKRLIAASFLLCACALLALHYADSYITFAAALFGLGLFGGSYLPSAVPILTSFFDQRHWGKVIAFHETAASFNILTIPVIVAFTMGIMKWRNMFLVLASLFVMIIAAFWFISPDLRPESKKALNIKGFFKRWDFWIMTALFCINSVSAMGIYSIVPLFLVDEKQMAVETANRVLGFTRIGGVTVMILMGFLLDRLNTKRVLLFLTFFSAISTIGLAAAKTGWILITMLMLQATFSVVFFPVALVAVSKLTGPDERGAFTGAIMSIGMVLGYGGAPLFLGAMADAWSFQTGLYTVGLITLCICPSAGFLRKI